MSQFSDEELSKLPRWAVRKIRTLEADRADYEKQAYQATTANPSAIQVDPLRGDKEYFLPDRAIIRFYLAKGKPYPYAEVYIRDGFVQIRTSDQLVIRAQSGNAVAVSVERF